jgi:hypothetical protein
MSTERLVHLKHPRHDLWMVRNVEGGWHWTVERNEATALVPDQARFWQETIYKRTTLITRQIDAVAL